MKISAEVVSILVDRDKNTIGARLYLPSENKIYDISNNDLIEKRNSIILTNAILDKNGFVRSKRGYAPLKKELKESVVSLYHGSPESMLHPKFGLGEDKHDYGRGLYLTPDINLAREWAVCGGDDGYLYKIDINLSGLNILDFDTLPTFAWIAELMSHRDADKSVRYKRFAPIFIKKYKHSIEGYDVIKGWRADSSYFSIAKRFVRNELDASLLNEALKLGDLGIQYCIKSRKAFSRIDKDFFPIERVKQSVYLPLYNKRDQAARKNLDLLINSERNTLLDTFDKYIR